MSSKNALIDGINPLVISKISVNRYRRHGNHPYWCKVMRKKHPIRAFFGLYENGLFDGVYLPTVVIRGSDHSALKCISCKSNDEATELAALFNAQLESFLNSLTSQCRVK
jgi:hypothetical protein